MSGAERGPAGRRGRRGVGVLLLGAALLGGCRPDDQATESLDRETIEATRARLDPAVQRALDEGNAAYRDGAYDAALSAYQRALDRDEGLAAAWFGVYMAHAALGNTAAADSALARSRAAAPGASLLHPPDSVP